MINFDIHRLIRQLLPTFLRKPIRIAWLEALMAPFIRLWIVYILWRGEKYYEVHVTPQTISMEAYLNRLFDPILKRIQILHGVDDSVYVSLREEAYDYYIPGDSGRFISLNGESSGDYDGFLVKIPDSIDKLEVEGVINRIKAAGTRYTIDDAPVVSYMYINGASTINLDFEENGGTVSNIEVDSSLPWAVDDSTVSDWLSVTPMSATEGVQHITVTCQASESERTANIVLKQAGGAKQVSIAVTQAAVEASFLINGAASFPIAAQSGSSSQDVTILSTHYGWTVGALPSWLTVVPVSGDAGTTSVLIAWEENAAVERNAVLTFTQATTGNIVTAIVTQAGTSYISITTAAQLAQLATEVNAGDSKEGVIYKLLNDINLATIPNFIPIGHFNGDYENYKPFKGTFDFDYHSITGLRQLSELMGEQYYAGLGLFGIAENATFKNLYLRNSLVYSKWGDSAAFLGLSIGCNLERIYVSGDIATEGSSFGGLIGTVLRGTTTVKECVSAISLEVFAYYAGCGVMCGSCSDRLGSERGQLHSEDNIAIGWLMIGSEVDPNGRSSGFCTHCYNQVLPIIGKNNLGASYLNSDVSQYGKVEPLMGGQYVALNQVQNCYYDNERILSPIVPNRENALDTPLTSAQMKTQSSLPSFNFDTTWRMLPTTGVPPNMAGYPMLKWVDLTKL